MYSVLHLSVARRAHRGPQQRLTDPGRRARVPPEFEGVNSDARRFVQGALDRGGSEPPSLSTVTELFLADLERRAQDGMETREFLATMTPSQLRVSALRWGIPRTTARVMAAHLVRPRAALRVYRRASEAGAGQLARLLVEFGGQPVPRVAELELEADRLLGWFPIVESENGWSVPSDFASALWKQSERQRFFASTLLARLPDEDVRDLLSELGGTPTGSTLRQRREILARLGNVHVDPAAIADAADEVEELQSLRSRDVASVAYRQGTAGIGFRMVLADGEEIDIVSREVAEQVGREFSPPQVEALARPAEERTAPSVRLPDQQPIGALITFATARAAEEALRCAEFRQMVARRLDERRVATRPGHTAASAVDVLDALGFGIDETALRGMHASA